MFALVRIIGLSVINLVTYKFIITVDNPAENLFVELIKFITSYFN